MRWIPRHQSFVIFLCALRAGQAYAAATEPAPVQVVPAGPLGFEAVSGKSVLLTTDVACWGPGWKWFSFPGPARVDERGTRVLSQSTKVGGSGQRINLSSKTAASGTNGIVATYEILCPDDTPLTGIAYVLKPAADGRVTSATVAMVDGTRKRIPLPGKIGAIEGDAVAISLLDGNGGEVAKLDVAPARTVHSDPGGFRVWLAKDVVPGLRPPKTTLTLTFAQGAAFRANEFDAMVSHITPEWFAYSVGMTGTPVDLSFLNKDAKGQYVPAGAHGFVRVKGDDFVFEDGTPARFWGVNVTASAAVTEPHRAEQLAERLARLGVNAVRLHHLDSDWTPNVIDRKSPDGTTQHLNLANMRKLDKLVFELKQRGIYVILSPWVGRSFLPGDGVPESEKLDRGNFGLHPYVFFDSRMQELHRKFLTQVWSHVNEYTGLAYKDDPAFALSELCNEFLYRNDFPLQPYRDEYYRLYQAWAQANGAVPDPGDRIFRQNFPLDHQKFFVYVMKTFFRNLYEFDRNELGLRLPICASNWFHFPWEVVCQADADYMDGHHYYGGDRIGAGYGLGGLWVAHPPGLQDGPFGPIGAMALLGKPVTSSECGNNPPKTYRSSYYVGLAAVACLQGWDSVTPYAYSQGQGPLGRLSAYEMESDPASIASLVAGALIYRRGDVSRARELAVMTLPGNEPYAMHWENNFARAYHNTSQFNAALETHRVRVVLRDRSSIANELQPAEVMDPASAAAWRPEGTSVRSDTGQLWRDWRQAVGTLDTPRTQAAYGKLGESGKPWTTSNCAFDISTPYATVVLSSLTDEPLKSSHRLLLTAVARAENRGTAFNLAETRIVQAGGAPVMAEPVVGRVTFETTAKVLEAVPISADGTQKPAIPLEVKDGRAVLCPRAEYQTLFYYISAQL